MTLGFQSEELCGRSPDRGGVGLGVAERWVQAMLSLR